MDGWAGARGSRRERPRRRGGRGGEARTPAPLPPKPAPWPPPHPPTAARHPCQRPLWLGTCLITVPTTLYQEPVIGTLGRLIGDFNLIDLSRHVSHTVSAAVMLYCVLVAVGRQRHIWLLMPVAAGTVAATIWLNLSAAPHARSTITNPELPLIYWVVCFGF